MGFNTEGFVSGTRLLMTTVVASVEEVWTKHVDKTLAASCRNFHRVRRTFQRADLTEL